MSPKMILYTQVICDKSDQRRNLKTGLMMLYRLIYEVNMTYPEQFTLFAIQYKINHWRLWITY